MATDWTLIRNAMNQMIDACEAMEALPIDQPENWARRSDFQPDVDVLDFLTRFWVYPEGVARDLHLMRERLGCAAKHPSPIARALLNMAAACAEAIGVPSDKLNVPVEGFTPHCPSAGRTIAEQLTAPARIARNWMIPGITNAIAMEASR